MDQFRLNLYNFEKNLDLAMDNFAPSKLIIIPKYVYHNHQNAKHHIFKLENRVIDYVNNHLFVEDILFRLNPSLAVINYLRTINKNGQFSFFQSQFK